jgi:hypothetical protein
MELPETKGNEKQAYESGNAEKKAQKPSCAHEDQEDSKSGMVLKSAMSAH